MTADATQKLRSFVERIEHLEQEKKNLSDDVRDIYGEAKSQGFDVKAIRAVVKLRKVEKTLRQQQQAIVDLYMLNLESPGSASLQLNYRETMTVS